MKIKFDITGAPEEPTLVLSTREGKKLGQIVAKEIAMGDYLNEASVLQFKVYKFIDGVEDPLWDQYTNFKLVWCQDWDMWFQMVLDVEETTETVKSCECTKLGEAELSQIMLYNIEINTENDILRDDYTEPTVFYDPEDPSRSLLNRMMEKAPHYSILHVDSTLANIQRTFTFDNESIYDSFQDVAEEIGCLFVFDSNSDEDGNIARTISVYDLESNCLNCGYRGEFTGVCPECGSTDIDEGYGEDTTIFVTADELSDDVLFTTDTDAVKNCFRLEAGDDLTTATVRNCNPNGSQYIYYFSDDTKAEMPVELVEKIDSYDELYNYYQNEYVVGFEDPTEQTEFEAILEKYNELIEKYREYDEDLQLITLPIVGYPALMNAYYETIDFSIYLQSALMPEVTMPETDAIKEAAKLTTYAFTDGENRGVVAVSNINSVSGVTATNAVVNMAKCIVDMRYQVKCSSDAYEFDSNTKVWTGVITVINYSDEDDWADSAKFSLTITGNYETYLRQCIEKTLNSDNTETMSITSLFSLDNDEFASELKKYCLDSLNMFYSSCESCLDILIEQGVADGETWGTDSSSSNPYLIYEEYRDKLNILTDEIALREDEIAIVNGVYDLDGNVITKGLQSYIQEAQVYIQEILDFEAYLGEELWLQFCAYRREDTYLNNNYISDGLNNAELFERALEFIEVASKELYKSAELQHSIESDLNNLLVMDRFKPLLNYFETGNWLRIRIDDIIYKLRLIGYELEWDNIESISLEFSDIMKIKNGVSDLKSIVNQAAKMATSYETVQHQASQGSNANGIVTGWSLKGLDVTNTKIIQTAEGQVQTWDEHGMLFRKYDDVTESYLDEQMKIVNSTIAITSDNWERVRTAIGRFYFYNPATENYEEAYGINAEVIVGQLILGENLGIYNEYGTLTFDNNGLTVTNGDYTFSVNPNSDMLLRIYRESDLVDLMTVSNEGELSLTGTVTTISENYMSVLGAGYLTTYYQGELFGRIIPVRSGDTVKYMSLLANGDSNISVSIGIGTLGYIFVNGGNNPNGYSQNIQLAGSTIIRGALTATSTATISGALTASSTATISGALTVNSSASISGSTTVGGRLTAVGVSSSSACYLTGGIYLNDSSYIGNTSSRDAMVFGGGDSYTSSGCSLWVGGTKYTSSSYTMRLGVNGHGYASEGWSGSSDETLKTNIKLLTANTDTFLDKLKPISFAYKSDKNQKIHFGVTYQNVCEALEAEGIDPEESGVVGIVTDDDGNEIGTLCYDDLIAPMIYEIQQLKAEISGLEAKLE